MSFVKFGYIMTVLNLLLGVYNLVIENYSVAVFCFIIVFGLTYYLKRLEAQLLELKRLEAQVEMGELNLENLKEVRDRLDEKIEFFERIEKLMGVNSDLYNCPKEEYPTEEFAKKYIRDNYFKNPMYDEEFINAAYWCSLPDDLKDLREESRITI